LIYLYNFEIYLFGGICKKPQEQKEKHNQFVDEQIEKNRQEQEERERLFAESDPELPNRLIADFNKKYKA
jgi:hypothetical protein